MNSQARDHLQPRLTLEVNEVDEAVTELADGTKRELVFGTVKVKGKLRVPRDLLRREELTISIADLDGIVVASGKLEVTAPKFIDIVDRGHIIGIEREHTAGVVED